MPIQIKEENRGKLVTVQVAGKLVKADYERCVPEFDQLIRQHGKLRLLFELTYFHGWEADALWGEIKLDIKHFADIERLAVVGDKKWEHVMVTFYKPIYESDDSIFRSSQRSGGAEVVARGGAARRRSSVIGHNRDIGQHDQDMPEICNWKWSNTK
jgi:hypothetical protein